MGWRHFFPDIRQLDLPSNVSVVHLPRRAGQGGAYNGPASALAKTAMPFEGFLGEMRNPSNDMPAYAAQVMSDQAAADIYAYLQSLPGPREAKDIEIKTLISHDFEGLERFEDVSQAVAFLRPTSVRPRLR
jgi:hypothetical protein